MVVFLRGYICKTLRVFLRVGSKNIKVSSSHSFFYGQYPALYKTKRLESEAVVLQMTHLCAFLLSEMMLFEGGIKSCQDGALTGSKFIAPDTLYRFSIEGIAVMAFVALHRLSAEKAEV